MLVLSQNLDFQRYAVVLFMYNVCLFVCLMVFELMCDVRLLILLELLIITVKIYFSSRQIIVNVNTHGQVIKNRDEFENFTSVTSTWSKYSSRLITLCNSYVTIPTISRAKGSRHVLVAGGFVDQLV